VLRNSSDWNEEGIAFFAYPSRRPGTIPIHRYYNRNSSDHFFPKLAPSHYNADCNWTSASLNGKNALSATNYNHCYEGVAWYAYSSAPVAPYVDISSVTINEEIDIAEIKFDFQTNGLQTDFSISWGKEDSLTEFIALGDWSNASGSKVSEVAIGKLSCDDRPVFQISASNDAGVSESRIVNAVTPKCQDDFLITFLPAILAGIKKDGSNIGSSCGEDRIFDCSLECVDDLNTQNWIGDGICDDENSSYGINYNCRTFQFDGGDCAINP